MKVLAIIFFAAASVFTLKDITFLPKPTVAGGSGPTFDTNGLVAWWDFDGNGNDSHTGGYNLTVGAAAIYSNDPFGVASKALYTTNNSTGYAYYTSNAVFVAQQFSVAGWFKSVVDGDNWYFTKNGSSASDDSWGLYRQGSANDRWRFQTVQDDDTAAVYTAGVGSNPDNTWMHAVVVVNAGNGMAFYTNGTLMATNTTVSTNIQASPTALLLIGAVNNGGTRYSIAVDQVSFWNRMLTATEASNLWNNGTAKPYSSL